jgi:hypothetical protein
MINSAHRARPLVNYDRARARGYQITTVISRVCDLNHPIVLTVTATLVAARKFPNCEVRHARDCNGRDCESGPA